MATKLTFPSGPRRKLATGLFATRGPKHKTPPKVAHAKAVAYSDTPGSRKNGQ